MGVYSEQLMFFYIEDLETTNTVFNKLYLYLTFSPDLISKINPMIIYILSILKITKNIYIKIS